MNPAPPLPAEEMAAALWAARLDGSTLSAGQRGELAAWLAADPARRLLLSSYCQFSADLEQQLPLLAGIRDEMAESRTASPTPALFPWLRRPRLAGVSLTTVAAVAVAVLWPHQPQNQFQNIATPVAQRSERTFADGTHVELNAQTALVVELKPDERRVRLATGEAFFHVSRDAQRPFFVETPAGSIRVTGTQFNVRTDALSGLVVTVLEGSVQVRPGEGGAIRTLATGDQLVRDHEQIAVRTLSGDALQDALAWRRGRIVFTGTPLREALGRFASYHGRNLEASDAAARQRVGGSYAIDDLDGFLVALEEVLPVSVIHNLDGSIRVDSVRR